MANTGLFTSQSTEPTSAVNARPLPFGLTWTRLALIAIVLIAAGLTLINTEAFGDGNTYYTAAIRNMLQSPSNFFFAVADAGGVTVDKPPVALWVQSAFAAVLGVSGFSVTLPSIIAGALSVLILYHLVQKGFGTYAGLIAALVLALTPVSVAVNRTNNLDSILILTLLLATWAFIRAVETGQWRHILLSALLIGVAFNVKMLQAYLVVPALYALYFLGARMPWRRKILRLGAATAILIAVSFSWALAVDLTPSDQRPYVGGSTSNSVIELVLGYNGLQRLLGVETPFSAPVSGDSGSAVDMSRGTGGTAPSFPGNMLGNGSDGLTGGPGGTNEVGEVGLTRLFETPLANEISWLLPFALLSIGLLALRGRFILPLRREHQAMVLWGGWLLTGAIFFSISGFLHAYYLATLAPALAALVGIGAVQLWRLTRERSVVGMLLAGLFLVVTVGYQVYAVSLYDVDTRLLFGALALSVIILLISVIFTRVGRQIRWLQISGAAFIATLLIIPASWSAATALESYGNAILPAAYSGSSDGAFAFGAGPMDMMSGSLEPLITYLEGRDDTTYDLVVPSSMMGSTLILSEDLDVLYLGGFSGQDPIYTVDSFVDMVEAGEVGLVLTMNSMGFGSDSAISDWVTESCSPVTSVSLDMPNPNEGNVPGIVGNLPAGLLRQFAPTLYDCTAT